MNEEATSQLFNVGDYVICNLDGATLSKGAIGEVFGFDKNGRPLVKWFFGNDTYKMSMANEMAVNRNWGWFFGEAMFFRLTEAIAAAIIAVLISVVLCVSWWLLRGIWALWRSGWN